MEAESCAMRPVSHYQENNMDEALQVGIPSDVAILLL
jgi:hypothetical protein